MSAQLSPPRIGRRASGLRRLACAVAACALGLAAWAAGSDAALAVRTGPDVVLTDADEADLRRIEDALNRVRSVRSPFLQNSSNGEAAQGTLYLSRPGRLRVDYAPPTPILVVADGRFLVYYDRRLEQVSYIPLGATPASILLEERIALDDDKLTITGFQRTGGDLRLMVTRTENPGEGSITLIFDQGSLQLNQWEVTDAQGIVTIISLIDPEFNVKLDKALFKFEDPRPPSTHSP